MLKPVRLSPHEVMTRILAPVPQVDQNAPLGLPDAPPQAPPQDDVELNPIAPIPIALHLIAPIPNAVQGQHIPMAVDAHELDEAHEPAGLNIDDEEPIRHAAGSVAAAVLAEEESEHARAEASDSELLTAENVAAEADAIDEHENTFALPGTGQNVNQRRANARVARMPLYLQEFELRRARQ